MQEVGGFPAVPSQIAKTSRIQEATKIPKDGHTYMNA